MSTAITTVLLVASLHSSGNQDFNNINPGIGFEVTNNLTYGIYTYHNSYKDQSFMLSVSKQWNKLGFGLAVANGYEKDTDTKNGILLGPEITYKFTNHIRIKTSAPFGTLIGSYDLINLQITF